MDTFAGIAVFGLPLLLLVGLAMQVIALWRFSGRWRAAAMVPALAMGGAVAVAVLGVLSGSNLAPIWVVFAAPLCLVWLFGLWLARGVTVWLRT